MKMKRFLKVLSVAIVFTMFINLSAFALSLNEKLSIARVIANKAVKARYGTDMKFRYVNGKPDHWIEGNSVVLYGTIHGQNAACDVIIDEAKDQLYVKSISF